MWRVVYPFLIHYLLSSIGITLLFWLIGAVLGPQEDFYSWSLTINGITSLFFIFPVVLWLYRRDWRLRPAWRRPAKLKAPDGIWSFLWGGSMAIALNLLLSLLQIFQRFPSYGEQTQKMTENVSFIWIVLWTAVVAPLVEEVVCRGLVYRRLRDYVGVWPAVLVSGLMFGIYHGNVVQGIYASVLGILMALLVEITGSLWASILFHVGANFISTFFSEFGVQLSQWNGGIGAVLFMGMCFLFFWGGICYFWVRWKKTAS